MNLFERILWKIAVLPRLELAASGKNAVDKQMSNFPRQADQTLSALSVF